jgi:hypothetical protein
MYSLEFSDEPVTDLANLPADAAESKKNLLQFVDSNV